MQEAISEIKAMIIDIGVLTETIDKENSIGYIWSGKKKNEQNLMIKKLGT